MNHRRTVATPRHDALVTRVRFKHNGQVLTGVPFYVETRADGRTTVSFKDVREGNVKLSFSAEAWLTDLIGVLEERTLK